MSGFKNNFFTVTTVLFACFILFGCVQQPQTEFPIGGDGIESSVAPSSFPVNEWFYQEAPTNVVCGTNWDSSYSCLKTYDGDWNTFGKINHNLPADWVTLTTFYYDKPEGLTNALWVGKTVSNAVNYSVPSSCFSGNQIQVKITMSNTTTSAFCWNGNAWQSIAGWIASSFYDEGIWFIINK